MEKADKKKSLFLTSFFRLGHYCIAESGKQCNVLYHNNSSHRSARPTGWTGACTSTNVGSEWGVFRLWYRRPERGQVFVMESRWWRGMLQDITLQTVMQSTVRWGFFPMSLDRETFTNREQRMGRCRTVGFFCLEIVHPTRCETSKMITEVVLCPVSWWMVATHHENIPASSPFSKILRILSFLTSLHLVTTYTCHHSLRHSLQLNSCEPSEQNWSSAVFCVCQKAV